MTDILNFRKVIIRKMPGIEPPGLHINKIEPQINIVYGPNAAGKTSLARACTYLLWPEQRLEGGIALRGEYTIEPDNWRVEIDSTAGNINYQKNGSISPRPPLPPAEHRDRYLIALHDLLQRNTEDRYLAEEIIRESVGGYQIAAAAEELGYKEFQPRSKNLTRKARKKVEEYRELKQKQRQLEEEERGLADLREELLETERARSQLEVLEKLLEYKEQRDKCSRLQQKLEQFPENMSNITGNETEELVEIKENIDELQKKKAKAEEQSGEAEKILQDVDLPADGVETGKITELKNKRDGLKKIEDKLSVLRDNLQEARVRKKEEQKNFSELLEEEKLPELDGAAYNELNTFARRAEEVENQLSALRFLKERLQPEAELPEREGRVERGVELLRSWLQLAEKDREAADKTRWFMGIAVAGISILSVVSSIFISPYFLFTLLLVGGLVWYGWQDNITPVLEETRTEFEGLELVPPREWETGAVKDRLRELEELLAEIKILKKRKEYWQERKTEYSRLQKKREQINAERLKLIEKYGVAPDTDEQTLYHLTNRLSRWQDAYNEEQVVIEKINTNEKTRQELLEDLNQILTQYGYKEVEKAAEIGANINDLEERNNKFQQAIREKEEAAQNRQEMEKRLEQMKKEKRKLFQRVDLEQGEEQKLQELCRRYDNYRELRDKIREAESLAEYEKKNLIKLKDFDSSLLDKDRAELKKMQSEYRTKADRHKEVFGRIKEIETEIKNAKKGSSVEEAFAEKERALDELETELRSNYEKLAGNVLVEHIQEISTTENRPQVFARATEILEEITRGRYQLKLAGTDSPSFRALDTATGKGKALSELSSGSRIQLLLAVRMAFVDREEEGLMLPLYLDETLANADDIKARAIIGSVIEFARRGRQCFYFTARREEVGKWFSLLEEDEEVAVNLIDLRNKRSNKKIVSLPKKEEMIPELESVPPSAGKTHAEYGQELSLPPVNPRLGAGSIHIWYLIEDTELLEHLLGMGIEYWGQLKILMSRGKENFVPAKKRGKIPEIKQLGYCLEVFIDSWQIGRGKPVDRSVLEASGAVSENFIEKVAELANEVEGKGKKIIEKLRAGEVSRFLSKKTDELEQYLKEDDYITETEPLSPEEIRLRMVSAVDVEVFDNAGERIKRLLDRLL